MKASMNKGSKAEVNKEGDTEQQNLFVDSSNVDLENKPVTTSKYYTSPHLQLWDHFKPIITYSETMNDTFFCFLL